jgi:hypothetical protein
MRVVEEAKGKMVGWGDRTQMSKSSQRTYENVSTMFAELEEVCRPTSTISKNVYLLSNETA